MLFAKPRAKPANQWWKIKCSCRSYKLEQAFDHFDRPLTGRLSCLLLSQRHNGRSILNEYIYWLKWGGSYYSLLVFFFLFFSLKLAFNLHFKPKTQDLGHTYIHTRQAKKCFVDVIERHSCLASSNQIKLNKAVVVERTKLIVTNTSYTTQIQGKIYIKSSDTNTLNTSTTNGIGLIWAHLSNGSLSNSRSCRSIYSHLE